MAEKKAEVPADRCGFELRREDVGFGGSRSRWADETEPVCCWRSIWESHDETDRCIWHADVDEKTFSELIAARADVPERLDGAILRNLHVKGEELSFGGCTLLGAKFDKLWLPEIDLVDTDLRYATFTDADLFEADFTDADLFEADFTDADLFGADFTDANLIWADFTDALLNEADFTGADHSGAYFTDADLFEADFTNTVGGADFTDADIREANFTSANQLRADFTNADLFGADFTNADTIKADFTDADIREADFIDADLQDADFANADVRKASFRHATLQDAVFTRTDCRAATFTSALLYETVFSDTRINSQTIFFDPKTTFYNSISSRPGCVYEENPLMANHPSEDVSAIDFRHTTGYRPEDVPVIDHLPKDVHPLEAARWVYRRLETLHEANALSEAAREFHISKEEAERALYWERGEYGPWGVKTLMWYLTRHGESVKRVLTWWGGVIFTAGLLFAGLGGVKDATGTTYAIASLGELRTVAGWQEILLNIYFSVTTFSTIMDGGLAPAGNGTRAVVAVESITGALLVALLVFVLGRRVAR
ncbi:pentapeptide repeat-containing protein [Halocatena marina]|uniref:Pentapeptide repeat-containing protein n=1 Tax=Halocatena marina TaxID=2934937 RepID=A0ABD5YUP0_9EURY|nr:pentapeptide repeat-containing protein [Halocatena marina]